ncbi:MAG: hypothetical protein HZA35_03645 [Parcubacteria group bacterium]|nr:hypothetical protein [Parcubacteria group bacterium]
MSSREKIAKLLRVDVALVETISKRLSFVTSKSGVIERIFEEQETLVDNRLLQLEMAREDGVAACYDALISRVEADDNKIFEFFGRPSLSKRDDSDRILEAVLRVAPARSGFFIKQEKAKEFLSKEPPTKVMAYLGYAAVEEMVAKEDLFELYAALRFVEGAEWLNTIFFKQYEQLTPHDFEERTIVVKTLSERWRGVAEPFVKKKWHNVSHLKELGVVFVLPVELGISGELLRMISMVFHYLHEIPFYSGIVRKSAEISADFSEHLISLLRGDVKEEKVNNVEGEKIAWFVIQRYLVKGGVHDWRLKIPHINPEALHWARAGEDLMRMGEVYPALDHTLRFWENLDWVGEYFTNEEGDDTLVSFNLVDTVMSLVQKEKMITYTYHQQEALWNKIFTEYFGRDELEKRAKEFIFQGYFEI